MDRFASMSVFRRVVERESFTLAAQQLGMSVGAVSKHVAWIEAHIGASLLSRTTRRLTLTEAGRSYYLECARILDDLDGVEKAIVQQQTVPRGVLKVRAPISLDYAGLGVIVGGFLQKFPAVSVEMTLNDRFVDLDDEGFDVALVLRGNRSYATHPTHLTRPIATMTRTLAATPGYVASAGMPATIPGLKHHNCLIYDRGPAPSEWHFYGANGEQMVHVNGNFRSNHSQVLKDAVLADNGIALLPTFLIVDALNAGHLLSVLPDWQPKTRTLYAVYPRPRHASPKIHEFVEFMASHFAKDEQWNSTTVG